MGFIYPTMAFLRPHPMTFKTNLAPILAYIYEIMHMTLKSCLIFSFDVHEWWSYIVSSVHVTSALSVGVEPQRACMLPGCVGSVLLAAEVFVGFAAQNWDMGACLRVAPEHAKCLALFMCDSKAICPIVPSLNFLRHRLH